MTSYSRATAIRCCRCWRIRRDTEREIFQHFTTTRNETWLHTDASFLPATPWARASWNYRLGASLTPRHR